MCAKRRADAPLLGDCRSTARDHRKVAGHYRLVIRDFLEVAGDFR